MRSVGGKTIDNEDRREIIGVQSDIIVLATIHLLCFIRSKQFCPKKCIACYCLTFKTTTAHKVLKLWLTNCITAKALFEVLDKSRKMFKAFTLAQNSLEFSFQVRPFNLF